MQTWTMHPGSRADVLRRQSFPFSIYLCNNQLLAELLW